MPENRKYQELWDDVIVWINEGDAISLKCVTHEGDPVELNEDQAEELARVLVELVREIRK